VVAEQRALPAAKAVESHRHRDRHVHAHHADLDALGKFVGSVAAAGEDGATIAIAMGIDQLNRGVQRRHADHA